MTWISRGRILRIKFFHTQINARKSSIKLIVIIAEGWTGKYWGQIKTLWNGYLKRNCSIFAVTIPKCLNNLSEILHFNFEGKDYVAAITIRKLATNQYYYVSLLDQELIGQFSISYLFDYTRYLGLQYVSTVQDPKNQALVETLKKALLSYIEKEVPAQRVTWC